MVGFSPDEGEACMGAMVPEALRALALTARAVQGEDLGRGRPGDVFGEGVEHELIPDYYLIGLQNSTTKTNPTIAQ